MATLVPSFINLQVTIPKICQFSLEYCLYSRAGLIALGITKCTIFITTGQCGRRSGYIKPFETLTREQMSDELHARQISDIGTTKKRHTQALKEALQGVHRVPSLLLNNPTQKLQNVNLEDYQILDYEPLHDLKGHLSNLFDELPIIFEQSLSAEVKSIIDTDLASKETKRGGDYRLAAVRILTLLRKRTTPPLILQLIETAVEISELLYAEESKRSPKSIFRFYNVTWIHFELCRELLSSPKVVTHRRLFGIYLHSISVHAPTQFEIVNLKATTTEHEERLFGQAKDLAQRATSWQPSTVVPQILLRIQAKQKSGNLYNTLDSKTLKMLKV